MLEEGKNSEDFEKFQRDVAIIDRALEQEEYRRESAYSLLTSSRDTVLIYVRDVSEGVRYSVTATLKKDGWYLSGLVKGNSLQFAGPIDVDNNVIRGNMMNARQTIRAIRQDSERLKRANIR